MNAEETSRVKKFVFSFISNKKPDIVQRGGAHIYRSAFFAIVDELLKTATCP